MKIKQTITSSGKYKDPNPKDLLVPDCLVCPECGMLIYPRGEDKPKTYYIPNMIDYHRYYEKHYAKANFTCSECGCEFSRTCDTYNCFDRRRIKLDLLKLMILISIVCMVIFAPPNHFIINNDIIRIIAFTISTIIFTVSLYNLCKE